jgi:predicted negative regulator of RcsB-dependent stress response
VADYLDEHEQWEQVLAWLREQGPWMAGTVVAVLLGFGGWRYWQNHKQRTELTAEAGYEQVLDAFDHNDFAGGTAAADRLAKDFPSTSYANMAELAVARVAVEHSQLAQAATRLTHVLDTTGDPELKLLARLRLARVQLGEGMADAALQTLAVVDPGAFAARYAEVRGDALLAKGDRAGALRAYLAARSGSDTLDTSLLDLKIDDLAHS